jgi:TDG/mug DNA glycosylase family protein
MDDDLKDAQRPLRATARPVTGASPAPPRRPSSDELQAAYGTVVPDLIRPGLAVLLVGINPSLWSGAVGSHFANPSNRLWPTLHAAGWTQRRLLPHETEELLACGCGITNLVARATARADELTDDELRAGLPRLEDLAQEYAPRFVAFLGLSAYRVATGERHASVGLQGRIVGPSRVWLLPNPSGLNASWQLPRLAQAYGALRGAVLATA